MVKRNAALLVVLTFITLWIFIKNGEIENTNTTSLVVVLLFPLSVGLVILNAINIFFIEKYLKGKSYFLLGLLISPIILYIIFFGTHFILMLYLAIAVTGANIGSYLLRKYNLPNF